MQKTKISWTKLTWNSVHGCHKVSAGCQFCYAEIISLRYGHTSKPWTKANAGDNVMLKPHKLREPYKIKEPSMIFVNSMSDLFHENVPDDYIKQVFDVMADLPQHTFQILTKRPERAAEWDYKWENNIWMGTSVESAKVTHRIDTLRKCRAKVLFISVEPMIAAIPDIDLEYIDWVIVGGESGDKNTRRDMPHSWARDIRDQCQKYGAAFFFKQSSAHTTERGTALQHEDGTFWKWEQFPNQLVPPVQVTDPSQMSALGWQRNDWIPVQHHNKAVPDTPPQQKPSQHRQTHQLSLFPKTDEG